MNGCQRLERAWGDVRYLGSALALLMGMSAGACRGRASRDPPLRLIRDMVQQPHLLPQSAASTPYGRESTTALSLTVAREEPSKLGVLETGKVGDDYAKRAPIQVDEKVLVHGEQRYNIYCGPCHDRAGTGQGMVVQRGYPGPIELASENTRRMTDGELFSIVTHGIRNMPALEEQVPVADRWAVVAWVRVLQRSQFAMVSEVKPPPDVIILPAEAAQ